MTAEFYMGLMLGLSIGGIGIFILCIWGIIRVTQLITKLKTLQQQLEQELIRSQKQPEE